MKIKSRIFALFISSAMVLMSMQYALADEVAIYDDIKFTNTCDTEIDGLTRNDGAPDGSSYYSYEGDSEFTKLGGLSADTTEDYMWEADVRFDEVYSGFTVKSTQSASTDTCIRRYDVNNVPMLAVQTGGSKYTTYGEIDADSWYHIQLIGQYGTDAPLKMVVYKWENGEMVLRNEYDNVNKRNNSPASYIAVQPGTGIDNIQITRLGADTLTITTVPEGITEINAGSGVPMRLSATRNGRVVNNPAVEWKVYENGNEIKDGSVTVTSTGIISVSTGCEEKDVVVQVVSAEKGNAVGSYELHIKAADFENEKIDKIILSADRDYVNTENPLNLSVSATKNGEVVTLEDGDIVWKIFDPNNLQEIGNKYITVENNSLYVTEKVIPQDIILKAQSISGFVSAYIPVRVEEISKDIQIVSDSCEDAYEPATTAGSWDGSHYYNITKSTSIAKVQDVSEEIIIEADVKFVRENSGFKLRSADGREGGQIARQGTSIGNIGEKNKFTAITDGNNENWYHIKITAKCDADNYYGEASVYRYDEKGELKKLKEGTILDMRTMATYASPFSYIDVMAGTCIDNVRIIKILPDEIKLSLSAKAVSAGDMVQAKYTVLRDDDEMAGFSVLRLNWEIYNEDNIAPIDDVDVTVDSNGLVTVDASAEDRIVYVRVSCEENGVYAAVPLAIAARDIFAIKGIGVNSDSTAITQIKVSKNIDYSGNVVFIIAVYDEDGALSDVAVNNIIDNSLEIGENVIAVDAVELPENFTNIKIMVWTSLS